jgi:predicted nucleic acid-binding Zn ribbon protein
MPIYQYKCEKCSNVEEILCSFSVKGDRVKKLICKKCGSVNFCEKLGINIGGKDLTSNSQPSGSGHFCSSSGCGSCGGGCC